MTAQELIFTIYLIRFFLTKQFPHKPEHTKCIKKTVQSVVMSEHVLNMNNVIYNSGSINVYHTKRISSAAPFCQD